MHLVPHNLLYEGNAGEAQAILARQVFGRRPFPFPSLVPFDDIDSAGGGTPGDSDQAIIPRNAFGPHPLLVPRLKAGTNVTITRRADEFEIASTGGGAAGDSDQVILAVKTLLERGYRFPLGIVTPTGLYIAGTGSIEASTLLSLGVDGDTECFGATLRQFRPAQNLKGDLGSSAKQWNQLHLGSTIATYKGITTVSNGVPSELATVDLATQAAAISATTIYTPAATGLFRLSIYLQVTRAASTSSILGGATGVVITFTDGDGSVAQTITAALHSTTGTVVTTAAGNTTATNLNGTMVIYAKTAVAIQYAIGYTSVGATTMQYAAHLKVEAL